MKRDGFKEIISLVIPIFLELLFINLLGFFDTFMISKFSQDSVIAVSNAATVIGIFTVLLSVASRGTNVIISQFLGAKDKDNAHKTMYSGIWFNLALAFILLIVVQSFGYQLLKLIKVDDRYIAEALRYLRIVSCGMPFLAITNVFGAVFRSYKMPKILTISSLISNVVNVLLNLILIFGITGLLQPLGSTGAGIATLISYVLNFIIGYIFLKKRIIRKVFSFKIKKHNLEILLQIGLPSALESFVYTFANMILMSAVNTLDVAMPGLAAGRSYLNQILSFIIQLSTAFGLANQILVGHAVGEGNYEKANKSTFRSIAMCLPIVEFLVLLLVLLGKYIFKIYTPNNPEELDRFNTAINEVLRVLPYIFLLELGRCLNIISINALQAAGDVIFPLINAIISMLLFMGFGSIVLGVWLNLGLLGVYLACAIDEGLRAIIMMIRWKSKKWQAKGIARA